MATTTRHRFEDALPLLLKERGLSLRALALRVDVDPTFLSRAVRGVGGKRVSVDLIERVTFALDLPADFFVEVRVDRIRCAVESDEVLRDRVYREVVARSE